MCEGIVGKDKAKQYTLTMLQLSAAAAMAEKDVPDGVLRFVPAMQEVKAALQLYREAGIELSSITGVPVFQAEGLYVEGTDKQVCAHTCPVHS